MDNQETKQCPYCGETINSNAKKCKHCGEWLEEKVQEEPTTIKCPYCGEEILSTAIKCKHCGELLKTTVTPNETIKKIASLQKISAILWIIISVIMILSGIGTLATAEEFHIDGLTIEGWIYIIVGIWNIIAWLGNKTLAEKTLNLSKEIPKHYDNLSSFIIMIFVNLIIAWYIGVALIGFDLYIRKLVMDNKQLFIKDDKNT